MVDIVDPSKPLYWAVFGNNNYCDSYEYHIRHYLTQNESIILLIIAGALVVYIIFMVLKENL